MEFSKMPLVLRRIFNKKGEVSMKVCSLYFVMEFFIKSNLLGAGTGTTGCICVIFIERNTAYDRT